MAEGRGKKAKKAQWQLVLGLKQVLCGALGLTWMMLIIFVLGVLAGRGDIYRWLSSWGLITPAPAHIAHWSPPPEAPLANAAVKSPPQESGGAKPAAPGPPATAPSPPTVTGSMTPAASSAHPPKAKKVKKGLSHRDHKTREEELRRLRREVAAKLKFQNSFDSKTSKTAHPAKIKQEKTAQARKDSSRQVRVARFRDLKTAKARMGDLQKRGEKVSLKKGKDKQGIYYDIFRETPAKQTRGEVGLAQKTKRADGNKSKRQAGVRN